MFFINLSVKSDERFDLAKFLSFEDNRFDPLDSFFLREIPKLTSRGQYAVQNEVQRPDLVSFRFYNTTEYWWIIMTFNDLLSVTELTAGKVLDIPSEDDISRLFFRLRPLDQGQNA